MKRYLKYSLFVILFFFCFSIKNVYAEGVKLSVCPTSFGDCQYTDLEDALTDLENSSYDYANLNIYGGTTYIISSHTIHFELDISVIHEYNGVEGETIIDGRGSTLTLNNSILFVGWNDLTIQNLNIEDNASTLGFLGMKLAMLFGGNKKVTLNNVHMTNYFDYSIDNVQVFGIYFVGSNEVLVQDSSFSNYVAALAFAGDEESISELRIQDSDLFNILNYNTISQVLVTDYFFKIENCDLSNNLLSIFSLGMSGDISNTKLSSFASVLSQLNFASNNDYGDTKVVRFNFSMDDNIMENLVNNWDLLNDKRYFVIASDSIDHYQDDNVSNISFQVVKKQDIDYSKTSSIDLLSLFIENEKVKDYDFSVSDPNIATIENGKVVFLKGGEVIVTATHKESGDTFVLQLKVTEPVNPKTGMRYITFALLILVCLSYIVVAIRYQKKKY